MILKVAFQKSSICQTEGADMLCLVDKVDKLGSGRRKVRERSKLLFSGAGRLAVTGLEMLEPRQRLKV
jgi:hypothetical protein